MTPLCKSTDIQRKLLSLISLTRFRLRHFAVTYIKSAKALKALVSAAPQSLLRRNTHQDTPLALAKAANAPEEVRTLLEKMVPKLDP